MNLAVISGSLTKEEVEERKGKERIGQERQVSAGGGTVVL